MGFSKEKIRKMEQERLKNPSELDKIIMDEFATMGLDYGYTGTHHLHDALVLAIKENPEDYSSTRKFLTYIFDKVRKKYGIKQHNHLISITYAIEKAFEKGNIDYLLDIFKGCYVQEKGSVDNRTFIMVMRNKIKHKLEERQSLGARDLRAIIQEATEKITDISALTSLCGIALALEKGGAA